MPPFAETESARTETPMHGLLLAYAAVLPIPLGTVLAWVLPAAASPSAVRLTVIWAAAVLCFLAGVRRGLGFRQPGGPAITQLAGALWLFLLATAALMTALSVVSVVLLLAGYIGVALADVRAARHGLAPRYFPRLRPPQMLLSAVALLGLLALQLR